MNYVQLNKLLPYLGEQAERVFGLPPDKDERGKVRCVVNERCKYTTTVTLHQDNVLTEWLPETSITVRLYHDARMAEVLSFQKDRQIKPSYPYPNKNMYQPDEKWQHNHFLGEWLSYCLHYGSEINPVDF